MSGRVNGLPANIALPCARACASKGLMSGRGAGLVRPDVTVRPAGSTAAVPSASAVVLAAAVRTGPGESDSCNDAPVAPHGLPVVVPVRVLT